MTESYKAEPRYTIEAYYRGFKILLTQPYENGGALIGLLDKLSEAGFTGHNGVIYQAPNSEQKESQAHKENGHTCPVHQVEMKRFEKNGQVWFSHKTDTGWCNGKAK